MQRSPTSSKRSPNVLRKKPPAQRRNTEAVPQYQLEGHPQYGQSPFPYNTHFATGSSSSRPSEESTQPLQPRWANQRLQSRFVEVVDPPALPAKDYGEKEREWTREAVLGLEWADRPLTPEPQPPPLARTNPSQPKHRETFKTGPTAIGGLAKPIPHRSQTNPSSHIYHKIDQPLPEVPHQDIVGEARFGSTSRPRHRHHRSRTVHALQLGMEEQEARVERMERAEEKGKRSGVRFPDPTRRAEIVAWQTDVRAAGGPTEKHRREKSRSIRPCKRIQLTPLLSGHIWT
ncbi:hypothetical protein BDN72DRAFT_848917 [Pluteus cervinus]|uniref:Uncharacterized protein n=1 Tax=Pluteus cervinus TaxID=181527 RepID=A0ACD3A9B9_9AGAR|nr:hypothetical protein BDN72DRAFT_848917 [Pluteus cervinus]